MASHSQDPDWKRIRNLENALAILKDIEDRRKIVRQTDLGHEGDLTVAYAEITAMGNDLQHFKHTLSSRWHELMETVQQEDK